MKTDDHRRHQCAHLSSDTIAWQCYQLALADVLDFGKIYSFDKAMDRYPGIERIEPE